MAEIKKILCFVSMNSHYQVLKDACLDYMEYCHHELSIVFFFCSMNFNLTRQIEDAKNSGFTTYVFCGEKVTPKENALGLNPANQPWSTDPIEENRRMLAQMIHTIESILPDLALISDNTIKHKVPLFIRACNLQKVSVMNIPFGFYFPTYDLKLETMSCSPNHAASLKPWLRTDSEGKTSLPLPVEELVSMEHLGITVPRPWAWNANEINIITVDSEYAYKLNIKQGLDPSAMTKIRSKSFTNPDNHRDPIGLGKKTGFRPTLPSVLVNVPAPLKGLLRLPQCKFKYPSQVMSSYLKLPRRILERVNIIWSVHPRLNKKDYLYVSEWGIVITDAPAAELIPYCDLFVGSDSTLFKTALMHKKPVINFPIRGDVELFHDVGGCSTVTDKHGYIAVIEQMIDDPIFYEKVRGQIDEDEFGYKSVSLPSAAELIHLKLNMELNCLPLKRP